MNSYKTQKNKLISIFLAFVMVFLNFIPTISSAMEKATPTGTAIRTEDELRNMSLGDQSVYYLANDIELTKDWSTLGSFRGVLDGNGYKITNLNITEGRNDGYDAYNYGLFSEIVGSGEVKNLGIEGSINISDENIDKNAVGISAGFLAGIISNDYYNSNNDARIKNCYVIGEINCDSELSQQFLGGLAGVYNGGIGDNCYSAVKGAPIFGGSESIKSITNFYYDSTLYNKSFSNNNVIGKTSEEMKSEDFINLLNKNVGDNQQFVLEEDNYPRQESTKQDSTPVENIKIYNEEDLKNINNNLSANYILMNDIELSSDNWTMIGSDATPFSGTFDGNGYVIKNLNYTGKDKYIGFISVLSGKVKNLGMENTKVTATGYVNDDTGTIVGTNKGTIENCYVINATVTPTKYTYRSGLIAGSNINGMIKNCYASGSGPKGGIAIGFPIGGADNYVNCYYDSDVFGETVTKVSGVVGKTTEEMKSTDFITTLNSNRGSNLKWYGKEDNYPSMKEPTYDGPNDETIEENNKLINELRKNISNSLLNTTDPWAIISMVANGNKEQLTNIEKFKAEAFENIKSKSKKDAYTLERYIIGLSALGVDARKLYNEDEEINAVENLGETANDLINSMIFELVAYDSGVYELPSTAKYTKEELINNILNKQSSEGGWSFSGRGEEVDMTAMAIHALSVYYNGENAKTVGLSEETYDKVKIAVNKAIDLLGEMKLEDGSYSTDTNASNSNANSTAMVITALSALGIDVQKDSRFIKYDKSPMDGLLKFTTEDNSGFGFMNNTYNAMATEQGFRALVSYAKFKENEKPYNIYQCNGGILDKVEVEQGIVKVGIYGYDKKLYESLEVKYEKNDTAYTVLKKLLGDKVVARGEGSTIYVESIDNLGEFDKGAQSGWVYAVNRISPSVSAGVYKLSDGDELIWHYTVDLGKDITNSFEKFDKFIKGDISNEVPVINVNDVELNIGQKFDAKSIVKATDKEDGDITKNIVITKNTVNTAKSGTYSVTYKVSDSDGNTVTKTIKVTVLNAFTTFTVNSVKSTSTTITGKGLKGATVKAYVNGKQIGKTATVDSNGAYKISIPKQKAGVKITVKISKSGYTTVEKTVTVLNVFSTFTVNSVKKTSTTITGKGLKGATVKAYVNGKQIGKTVTVDSKGAYKISIAKQKAGVKITVKMSKSSYATSEKTVTVLNTFSTFTVNSVKKTSTKISGKGLKGATVKAYVNGKQIGKTATVDSKGAYKISISKQKVGVKITVKISKSGYYTVQKTITTKK